MAFSEKIMIVEDDPAIRESLGEICRMLLNVEPLQAASADEALALFSEHRPVVALVDLFLSGDGGESIVREIHQRGWQDDIRVIIMSAHRDAAAVAERMGVFGVLHKPFSLQDVTQVLEAAGVG